MHWCTTLYLSFIMDINCMDCIYLKKTNNILCGHRHVDLNLFANKQLFDIFLKIFKVPIKNGVILAYHLLIKMYTGLPLVI